MFKSKLIQSSEIKLILQIKYSPIQNENKYPHIEKYVTNIWFSL